MGMAITFMAKFNEREGNSCHIHFSLADDDGPLFARDRAMFDAFLAGQLAALRELTLLLAPNINSYKRYAAGSFAPTAIAWGHDNRTCSLRVVGHGPALRFENRAGGADLNPYLALVGADRRRACTASTQGSTLGAGLRGRRLQRRRSCRACRPRCATARDLFANSQIAREAFGEEVVAHYVNAADVELAAFGARGHRLGALPGLRTAVTVAAAGRARTRSSRRSARRPRSRRRSSGSAPRSSSACSRRARGCRPSASSAASSASRARRCARRCSRSARPATCRRPAAAAAGPSSPTRSPPSELPSEELLGPVARGLRRADGARGRGRGARRPARGPRHALDALGAAGGGDGRACSTTTPPTGWPTSASTSPSRSARAARGWSRR